MAGFGRREIEYMQALCTYNKYIECYSVYIESPLDSKISYRVVLVFVEQFLVSVQTVLLEQSILYARKSYDNSNMVFYAKLRIRFRWIFVGFVNDFPKLKNKSGFSEGSDLDSDLV